MPRRPPAVAKVLERVTKTAREHDLFAPGDLVEGARRADRGLAVS